MLNLLSAGREAQAEPPRTAPDWTQSGHSPGKRETPQGWKALRRFIFLSTPDRIRTCDLCLRRAALYPAELRAQRRTHGISRVLSAAEAAGGSFIWDRHCWRPRAAYPGLGRSGQLLVLYLALLQVGFAMRLPSPAARCALTAPFHPCLCLRKGHRRSTLCCTFRHRPKPTPGRYPAPCPVELGLSSIDVPRDPTATLTSCIL